MASSSRGVQQDSFIDDDDLTWYVHPEAQDSWQLQVLTAIRSSPLCVEEFDLSDRNFRPCPCGYQVRSDSNTSAEESTALGFETLELLRCARPNLACTNFLFRSASFASTTSRLT